jgi:hypothetical protein
VTDNLGAALGRWFQVGRLRREVLFASGWFWLQESRETCLKQTGPHGRPAHCSGPEGGSSSLPGPAKCGVTAVGVSRFRG